MILTVTPDPVLDKILFIDEWAPDILMQARKTTTSIGGKGLDSSVVLRHLNVDTLALTYLAGKTGQELQQLVEEREIPMQAVWADGETRTSYIISEINHQRHSHIFSGGLAIDDRQHDLFLEQFVAQLDAASWVICGGVIPASRPPTLYRALTECATAAGVPVLIDGFRAFIREAMPARPDILKMNWQEFEWTFDRTVPTLADLQQQAWQIYQEHKLKALVITCGADGILAYTSEGNFHATPPQQRVVNAAGAGDAASATLAWRFTLGDPWPAALKWAAAVSAAVVLTEGTADCHQEDIERIYPDVTVRPVALNEPAGGHRSV